MLNTISTARVGCQHRLKRYSGVGAGACCGWSGSERTAELQVRGGKLLRLCSQPQQLVLEHQYRQGGPREQPAETCTRRTSSHADDRLAAGGAARPALCFSWPVPLCWPVHRSPTPPPTLEQQQSPCRQAAQQTMDQLGQNISEFAKNSIRCACDSWPSPAGMPGERAGLGALGVLQLASPRPLHP